MKKSCFLFLLLMAGCSHEQAKTVVTVAPSSAPGTVAPGPVSPTTAPVAAAPVVAEKIKLAPVVAQNPPPPAPVVGGNPAPPGPVSPDSALTPQENESLNSWQQALKQVTDTMDKGTDTAVQRAESRAIVKKAVVDLNAITGSPDLSRIGFTELISLTIDMCKQYLFALDKLDVAYANFDPDKLREGGHLLISCGLIARKVEQKGDEMERQLASRAWRRR